MPTTAFPELKPEEAANLIDHDAMVAFSAFTPAGAAKAVPHALAQRAKSLHDKGDPYTLRVLTGASTNAHIDDALAEQNAISWRAPYAGSRPLREAINEGRCEFIDMHLSHVPQMLDYGFLGKLDWAVVEATDITPDGRVYLTTSVGATPTFLHRAKRVIIEINSHPSPRLWEMHDIATLPPPPIRQPIPIDGPLTRIGVPFASVDPAKIIGVVRTNEPDGTPAYRPADDTGRRIAAHVREFLLSERAAGRLPDPLPPIQAGVGNISNAVMGALGEDPDFPPFAMFTEVLQDTQLDLMRTGHILGASTSAIAASDNTMQGMYDDMPFFAPRIVLRPSELSNNPGVVRRLGVVTINTILEMDIYGLANSTHVAGTQLMNGIGGSGDFVRNGYLSILMAPSTAKKGAISTVVPMVSHVDHNEHSVDVLVTEQGLADLRGKGPAQRAEAIINNCAHPAYRDYLHSYLADTPPGHFRHDLARAFELHQSLIEHGTMLPSVNVEVGIRS